MFFEAISASLLFLIVNLIVLLTVSVAILRLRANTVGKIYNKCMVKVGSLMLYNLRKVEILKFL